MYRFQSTCPARGTTLLPRSRNSTAHKISIHVPREGHDGLCVSCIKIMGISIHVPREGHDTVTLNGLAGQIISIHVPREGHDVTAPIAPKPTADFNPRAPRGARRRPIITAPISTNFNPRAPRGARLDNINLGITQSEISIHVPREGHDRYSRRLSRRSRNFNPRAPRGARLDQFAEFIGGVTQFQSTCPARGTTMT